MIVEEEVKSATVECRLSVEQFLRRPTKAIELNRF
jgi:hypothetical protein